MGFRVHDLEALRTQLIEILHAGGIEVPIGISAPAVCTVCYKDATYLMGDSPFNLAVCTEHAHPATWPKEWQHHPQTLREFTPLDIKMWDCSTLASRLAYHLHTGSPILACQSPTTTQTKEPING